MPDFHSMSRLSLIGLLLLLQAGCSTTSLRNLFSWNRRGDYHTLEELEKQSGKKAKEPTKTASWNPLKRNTEAATKPAEAPVADSAGAADQTSGKQAAANAVATVSGDPFLKDDAAQPDRKRSEIRRVSAEISQPEPAEAAEPLITGRVAKAASGKPSENLAKTSLEARKLAELDALLEGRELAGARRLSSEAVVKAGQVGESAKRVREVAQTRVRDTVAAAERTVAAAQQSALDADSAIQDSTEDESDDRAEPLIRNRASQSAAMITVEEAEVDDIVEHTSVAAAEELFGSLRPAAGKSAEKRPAKASEFSWKMSTVPKHRDGNSFSGNPLKLAGMERELSSDNATVSPEFDDQPVPDVKDHEPTAGETVENTESVVTGSFDSAAVSVQMSRAAPKRIVDETGATADETDMESSEESPAPSAGMGRTDLLLGLSARSWGLAIAGAVVIALLFLPVRRRDALRQTAVGHA